MTPQTRSSPEQLLLNKHDDDEEAQQQRCDWKYVWDEVW
jgi:hypothetical protein